MSERNEVGEQEVRETCRQLIGALPTCLLTTVDERGYPQTTAMLNLRCAAQYPRLVNLFAAEENEFCVYMSTANQSAKMVRLKANPKVGLYFCDADHIVGVMLGGDIEVVEDQTLKDAIWHEDWTMYYPDGPQGPEYGVLKLAPRIARGWRHDRPFEMRVAGGQTR